MPRYRPPFTTRKVTSVVMNPGSRRVTVHAYSDRRDAQVAADSLNVGELVKIAAEDDRPYAVRRAEAEATYAVLVAR